MNRFTLTLLLVTTITGKGFAQDRGTIPPPSDTPPPRIRIPISNREPVVPDSAAPSSEEAEEEIAVISLAAQAKGWVPPGTSGMIRRGMQIRASVMVQGQIVHTTEVQRIGESGQIGLPLLNNIFVADMSIESIETMLTEEYRKFYREPLVNVEYVGASDNPSESPWGFVTMMGNVGSPGPLAMPPTGTLTVSGALKQSGGLSASAKEASIRIYRPIPSENIVERLQVDLLDLGRKGRHSEDIILKAGDVVYVPERIF